MTLRALCACDFMSILSNFQQKDPMSKKKHQSPHGFFPLFEAPVSSVLCISNINETASRHSFTAWRILSGSKWHMKLPQATLYKWEWKHVDFLKTFCRKPFFPPQTNLQTRDWWYWLHFWATFFWSAWTECNDPRLLRRFVVNLQVFGCFFMCQTPSRRGLGSDSYHQQVKGLRK